MSPRRIPSVWYRESRQMYCSKIEGKVHPLGVTDRNDRAGAEAALYALLRQLGWDLPGPAPTVTPAKPREPTAAEATADFLRAATLKAEAGKLGRKSLKNYRDHLGHFRTAFGEAAVTAIDTETVERWADVSAWTAEDVARWPAHKVWSASYQNNVLGTVGMVLKRAGRPVRFNAPPKESRGPDVVLTDEQFARVLTELRPSRKGNGPDLVALLEVLRETGARPEEGCLLAAETIDWSNACVRLKKHKTKRKTKKDRVLHFNAAAMAVLTRQREKYGTGLLFRNGWGTAFTPARLIERLEAVSKVVGFRVVAYGLGRHTFATTALANGASDATVAALLGHVDTTMIHRNYSHLGDQAKALKAAAELASGKRAG